MNSPANREREIFNSALDRPTKAERIAYLDGACGEDLELRARVEMLLRSHDQAGGFLPEDDPKPRAGAPATTFLSTPCTVSLTEKVGDRIGHYKLLQKVGEGGCGVVYMAEQQEPVRRRVALKVIKLGMDTKSVIARFEAERQALALMDHPNIARVLDAGSTDTGRPYFVMELVRGVKITEFCDEQNLSTAERLKLFIQVCQAIQHAHQKGVIHRDIKPSNVLVTINDGVAVSKVIDFGIAKATTDQRLTDKTLFTALEQFLGTPAYMSPEQAVMTTLDIDTRSDIYSLGVLLYELLTGSTPFDQRELLAAGLDEMRRTIREKDPERPSTRVSAMRGDALTTTAKQRGLDGPKLIHALRGDLDWIVMKCLEKERGRRYETANGLAADVQRHLNCEMVMARPPSRLYEFQKTVRRHKFGFAAGTGIIVALAVGVAASTRQAIRATRAEHGQTRLRERAESAERESRNQLYTALVEQARATVRSGDLGQRVRALDAILRAAAISNSTELRGAALAALALPDLRFEKEISLPAEAAANLDPSFERLAIARGMDATEIRTVSGGRLLASLPPSAKAPVHVTWWSPDGQFLAVKRDRDSAGYHADLEVWAAAEARRVLLLNDLRWDVVDFHPILPRIVAGRQDGIACVFDLSNGVELARFKLPGTASRIRFAPDGERLAYGGAISNGWLVSIHSAADGSLLASNRWGAEPTEFSWSPDGDWLAVPDLGSQVHLMNPATGELRLLGQHKAQAITTAFSPDGSYLFTGGWDRELICWDLRAKRRAFDISLDSFKLRVRADGGECAVQTMSGALKFYSFLRPAYREFSEDLGARIEHATFSADGRWLAASGDKYLGLWNLTGRVPGALTEAGAEARAFFTPDGSELFTSRDEDCARWKIREGTNADSPPQLIRAPMPRPPGFTSICLGSNFVVITATNHSTIVPFDHMDEDPVNWSSTASGKNWVSPDGRWLGICHSFSPSLYIYSLPGLRRVAKLTADGNIWRFWFLPLREEVAISARGTVTFWSTATWQPTRTLTNFVSFLETPDPRLCWLARDFRSAGLYDARTLEPLLPLPIGTLPLALSADGRRLAVSVDGRRLQVWDLADVRARLRELGLDPNGS